MKKWIVVAIIVAIVAIAAGFILPHFWPLFPSAGSPGDDYLLKANADDLTATVVTPHLECPIAEGKNVLWCSTFQLAWNEACDLIGEDIHLEDESPMVAIMNKKAATKADIDEASYVALAGFVKDGILDKIPAAVREKFGEGAPTRLADTTALSPAAPGLAAYACLVKDLRFETPFEPLNDGQLAFRGTPVKAFGVTDADKKDGSHRLTRQVIHYAEDDSRGEGI